MQSYYDDDSIVCSIGGIQSNKHVLRKGLRQGCNLSPVLFSIYISDLSYRLADIGFGKKLSHLIMINHLLFADDLLLISPAKSGLIILLSVLNTWCVDFKMKISETKSKIVSTVDDIGWPSFEEHNGYALTLEQTKAYKYLGVSLKANIKSTRKDYNEKIQSKARSWAKSIMHLRHTDPDKVCVALALWINYAIPSLLYGTEVLQTNQTAIRVVEVQQNIL